MIFLLCDFCNAKFAVLHCTADSANLCLFCDRRVHSANILSLKHTRWWICHNCGAKQASVRSSKNGHGLFWFCQGCACNLEDQSHTTCCTVEEFSGCPSANMLASVLGLNNLVNLSSFESCLEEQKVVKILDGYSLKNELCEQLVEMGRRDLVRAVVDGAELRPQTPPSRRCGQMTPFSSLLLLPPMDLGLKLEQRVSDVADEEEDLLWDYNPTYDPSLMLDFHLEKSKDCEESGSQATETEHGMNKTCLITPKYEISTVLDDALYENNHSSQLLSNHAPATEESIRKQSVGLVTEFELAASEDLGHLLFSRSDTAKGSKSKADMEMVAQNRGNAMLRYKEKKKTRRYDKHIRYESRKARADTRKRVKGRFVKSSEAPDNVQLAV